MCLPTESECPEHLLPWETAVCEQITLNSPEQSRTSHLLMFAVSSLPGGCLIETLDVALHVLWKNLLWDRFLGLCLALGQEILSHTWS